jgi:hypothetical protein
MASAHTCVCSALVRAFLIGQCSVCAAVGLKYCQQERRLGCLGKLTHMKPAQDFAVDMQRPLLRHISSLLQQALVAASGSHGRRLSSAWPNKL